MQVGLLNNSRADVFFFFHLQIPSVLYFGSVQGRFDELKDDRAVVSQGDMGFIIVSLGEVVDGDMEII